MMLVTPKMREILAYLATEEGDGDLMHARPGGWWYGHNRTAGKVGVRLLQLVLVSVDWETEHTTYYHINEEGRAALADPDYQPLILKHLAGM